MNQSKLGRGGSHFSCGTSPSLATGEDALARLSFEESTVKKTAVAQGAILAGCYFQTYRVLKNARPRYATMKPPRAF